MHTLEEKEVSVRLRFCIRAGVNNSGESSGGENLCVAVERFLSSHKTVLIVPLEKFRTRSWVRFLGQGYLLTLPAEIFLSIVEVATKPPANLEAVFGSNRNVASVKKDVEVTPEE